MHPISRKKKVLILCTHNSVRSQMAEGILRHLGGDRFEVKSAGSCPCGVNPDAIKVLSEIGIDISSQYSKDIQEFVDEEFDYVITVCDKANQTCPAFAGKYQRIHWPLEDPGNAGGSNEDILKAFRETRNKLKKLISEFISNK